MKITRVNCNLLHEKKKKFCCETIFRSNDELKKGFNKWFEILSM